MFKSPHITLTLLSSAAMALVGCNVGTVTNGPGGGEEGSGADGGTGGGDDGDDGVSGEPDADVGPLTGWCQGQPENFSFFVTSMSAMWKLAGSEPGDLEGGFGGNYGGIAGADEICQTIGAATGFGDKTWRAFLSATNDGTGSPVHAIDRIGTGPWYDANGRMVASGLGGLGGNRPDGDAQSTQDLPDECGVPLSALGDAHDVVTGSNAAGRLASNDPADSCNDWTSIDGSLGEDLMCGHSFPRSENSGLNWASDHPLRGCARGANLLDNGAGEGDCIGCSGGYGALYCFAL